MSALERLPLNELQRRAVRAADRHSLVVAGAGTGKTRVVVGRVLHLLDLGRDLSEIAAITFTNAAAADLKGQLRGRLLEAGLGAPAFQLGRARIGTIHHFALELLREFALRGGGGGRGAFGDLLDAAASAEIVAEEVRNAALDALGAESEAGPLARLVQARDFQFLLAIARSLLAAPVPGRLEEPAAGDAGPGAAGPHPEEPGPSLLALARDAEERVRRRLVEQRAVDFDRALLWARDLLGEPAVQRAVQRRLHTLIIDEFQDTDPVQREIAYLIGEPGSGRSDTPRLLLVGDPKQSIYRFRGADVGLWSRTEREFRAWGHPVVELDENYRSVPAILEFVERVVGPAMSPAADAGAAATSAGAEFEILFAPLKPTLPPPGEPGPSVEILVVPAAEDGAKVKAERRRELEATQIACRARELLDAGSRPAAIALLCAAAGSFDVYADALRARDIPTYVVGGTGFFARREVEDLVLALRVARSPRDDEALVGFLRSPFVALSDESLLRLALLARPPLVDALERLDLPEPGEAERLAAGRTLVRRLAALRDRVPHDRVLEEAIGASGYRAHLDLGPEGQRAVANVERFLQIARGASELATGDFLRRLAVLKRAEAREPEALLYGETEDVVRLSTIHKAKGLEWEVVFWTDLAGQFRRFEPKPCYLDGGRLLLNPDSERDDWPDDFRAAADLDRAAEQAERRRLWYVAATRAKRLLVLCGVQAPDEKGRVAWGQHAQGELLPDLGLLPEGVAISPRIPEAPARPPEAEIQDAEALGGPEPEPAIHLRAGPLRHSATALLTHGRCAKRHWFRYVAGLEEPLPGPTADPAGPDDAAHALERGLIVHGVLERLEEEAELAELLEEEIVEWAAAGPGAGTAAGERYREALADAVRAVWQRDPYRALAGRPLARRELRFDRILGPDGATLAGACDLVAPGEDGLTILDVKTGAATARDAEGVAERYAAQEAAYVAAVGALSPAPVTRYVYQFSGGAGPLERAVGPAERAEAETRLCQALDAIGPADVPLAVSAAECSRCGYYAARWCAGVAESDATA